MIFVFGDYIIDIDTEKTAFSRQKKRLRCECPPCRIFRKYVGSLNDDVKKKLDALGLDIENPDEVYDVGKDERGNIRYGGWWNMYGKIAQTGEKSCRISDGFEVTFRDDCPYVPQWFRDECSIQMRFTIDGDNLAPLGKEYRAADRKNTFVYHLSDETCSALQTLVGGELVGVCTNSDTTTGENIKCHEVDIFVKRSCEEAARKLTLSVSRDTDTCFDGIDRMVLTIRCSSPEAIDADFIHKTDAIACPGGQIKSIQIFESRIEGEKDRVVYDSHIMITLASGQMIIFRAEPDGQEVITVFFNAENVSSDTYLRVSDTWFVHPAPIFGENDEVIGLKHFYQTETNVRFRFS